jgi:hypothetical protein
VYVNNMWQTRWNSTKTSNSTKTRTVHKTADNNRIKYTNKSRGKQVAITRLRLGHCSLNNYLRRVGRHTTGLCETCRVPETVEHYLMSCRDSKIREIIQGMCKKEKVEVSRNNVFQSNTILDAIYKYIKRAISIVYTVYNIYRIHRIQHIYRLYIYILYI